MKNILQMKKEVIAFSGKKKAKEPIHFSWKKKIVNSLLFREESVGHQSKNLIYKNEILKVMIILIIVK